MAEICVLLPMRVPFVVWFGPMGRLAEDLLERRARARGFKVKRCLVGRKEIGDRRIELIDDRLPIRSIHQGTWWGSYLFVVFELAVLRP